MSEHVMTQVRMPYTTDRPGDLAINTFHWFIPTGVALDAATFTDIGERLLEFYTTTFGTFVLGEHFGKIVSREVDACSFVHYLAEHALVAGKVRFGDPLTTVPWSMPEVTGVSWPLPLEVAICASFEGTPHNLADAPMLKRRRRGRFFLGPLTASMIDEHVDGVPNVLAAQAASVSGLMERLAQHNWIGGGDTGPVDGPLWMVWSRGTQESTVTPAPADTSLEGASTVVISGWVDHEFDTQRRRQIPATDRDSWEAEI